MAGDGDDMPRAKRLKMLREAKERKERLARGESVEDIGAGVESVAIETTPVKRVISERDNDDESNAAAAHDSESDTAEDDTTNKQADSRTTDSAVLNVVGVDNETESELLNLAPKRANWDIERDIAPMLKKLEKRTQYAIVEILREKLAAEQAENDDDEDEEDEGEDDEGEDDDAESEQ